MPITRALAVALLALSTAVCVGAADQRGAPPAPAASQAFDSGKAFEHLKQMVALGPRPAGSPALKLTRAYITKQLAASGLTVTEQTFTASTPVGMVPMVNLILTLPGRRPERILFTGHYDTKPLKGEVFVGASDGASSGAFLMELARVLKDRSREFTYEFVWFDGEEAFCLGWDECAKPGSPDNTYGSRYYVDAAKKAGTLGSIKAMILVDMIGARTLRLEREAKYSAKWLNDIIWAAAKTLSYGATFVDVDTQIEDDHQPFFEAGVACSDLIDLNDYPQWHTAQDDLDHVAARSLQIVGDVVLAALPEIEKYLLR
jgi:Zn-dependent M28 family amino/carboxypeptidase